MNKSRNKPHLKTVAHYYIFHAIVVGLFYLLEKNGPLTFAILLYLLWNKIPRLLQTVSYHIESIYGNEHEGLKS